MVRLPTPADEARLSYIQIVLPRPRIRPSFAGLASLFSYPRCEHQTDRRRDRQVHRSAENFSRRQFGPNEPSSAAYPARGAPGSDLRLFFPIRFDTSVYLSRLDRGPSPAGTHLRDVEEECFQDGKVGRRMAAYLRGIWGMRIFLVFPRAHGPPRPLPRLGARHRLVAAATDRHDHHPLPSSSARSSTSPRRRIAPFLMAGLAVWSFFHTVLRWSAAVLLRGRSLHPPAPGADGHLPAAHHAGRRLPLLHRPAAGGRLADVPATGCRRLWRAAEPAPDLAPAAGVRLVAGHCCSAWPTSASATRTTCAEVGFQIAVLPDADHVPAATCL